MKIFKGAPVKFKIALYSIIMFLLFTSCNKGNIVLVGVYDVDIPERVNLGQAIHFTMHCETPTPGYKFHHTEIKESAFNIYFKVYAKSLRGGWIQVVDSFTTSEVFIPDSRGNYTFHFYQSYPSEYLTKVVTVQ